MDNRFENLIRRRDYHLAVVLLTILSLLMLAANRFVYPLMDSPQSKFELGISYCLIGVVLAELALLAVWTSLGSQPLLTRIQILLTGSIMLIAAWLLGYVSTFADDVGLNWANREEIFYLGWLPLILFAISLPLIVLRFFASRVLGPNDSQTPPVRQPITTQRLMMSTALVAFILAMIQLPALIGNQQADNWAASGGIAGIFFLFGLLILLPSILFVCSSRRSFLRWSIVAIVWATLVVLGSIYALSLVTRFRGPLQDLHIPVSVVATAMVVFLFGILVIRLFGYRLTIAMRSTDLNVQANKRVDYSD